MARYFDLKFLIIIFYYQIKEPPVIISNVNTASLIANQQLNNIYHGYRYKEIKTTFSTITTTVVIIRENNNESIVLSSNNKVENINNNTEIRNLSENEISNLNQIIPIEITEANNTHQQIAISTLNNENEAISTNLVSNENNIQMNTEIVGDLSIINESENLLLAKTQVKSTKRKRRQTLFSTKKSKKQAKKSIK